MRRTKALSCWVTIPCAIWALQACSGNQSSNDSLAPSAASGVNAVLTGPIEQLPESRGIFVWGERLNKLCQQWSVARYNTSGWFYGSSYSTSSADVYVLRGVSDPRDVIAAENFSYTEDFLEAGVGDTVLFRGRNGFFGAWSIEQITGDSDAVMTGTWYFKAGGGGDFTASTTQGDVFTHNSNRGDCSGY